MHELPFQTYFQCPMASQGYCTLVAPAIKGAASFAQSHDSAAFWIQLMAFRLRG